MIQENMLGRDAPHQESVWKIRITRAMQLVLQHDELAVVLIFAIHLYVDWYLGLALSAQILELGLLLVFFVNRSEQRPWVKPRALWLWIIFLLLAIFPALRGINPRNVTNYYFNALFNALPMFWLGLLVALDVASVRRLFKMLAAFATILAIHTIIEARTGIILFKTSHYDKVLDALLHFELGKTGIYRAEAFMLDPNSNGALFALMLMLPLGLFVDSSSWRAKTLYLVEIALMLLALLFTYSTGAWFSLAMGVLAFIIFVGSMRARVQIVGFLLVAILAGVALFSSQIYHLAQHAMASDEWTLRLGVWQTAIRVILAFPLAGVGFGYYMKRSDPYRVPAQFIPTYHAHDSYLEVATVGGIPLALMFIALLGFAIWLAFRNWRKADKTARALLGGGLAAVMALSFYSFTNAGWTLSPLLTADWLILGALASPLLLRKPVTVPVAEGEKVIATTKEELGE